MLSTMTLSVMVFGRRMAHSPAQGVLKETHWVSPRPRRPTLCCLHLPYRTAPLGTPEHKALGYLTDLALDDIFEGIDTSMYDSDIPSALTGYPSWVCGVSSWGDKGLKRCLTDLNDLDHIMEILVNS